VFLWLVNMGGQLDADHPNPRPASACAQQAARLISDRCQELARQLSPAADIRCLGYTRPSGGLRRALTRLGGPWVYWAYGAAFDRQTEMHVPQAGLQLFESRFVADELIKLLGARA
jgi:hypothetical protein